MKFSEKLIELRKQKGLSQEELGNQVNVSRQSISKWEAENATPEIEKVKQLSEFFGVSIEYLLNDEINNPNEKICAKNNKKAKKVILAILLTIIIIYLIYCAFKFIVLLRVRIKANNIADYDNYSITISTVMNDQLYNVVDAFYTDQVYSYGKILREEYSYDNDDDSHSENSATYINLKENIAYRLTNVEETDTYIYEDLMNRDYDEISIEEELGVIGPSEIRNIAVQAIPDNFIDILLMSINPCVSVSIGDLTDITCKTKNYDLCISFNTDTGILDSTYGISDTGISYSSYDYIFDNDTIPGLTDEPDLEEINYITYDEYVKSL